MIQNHLKIAFRNLKKNKALGIVRIFGLALAIATASLLFLTAMYELSYNDFHQDKNRIGMLYTTSQPEEGVKYASSMPAPLADVLKSGLPDIVELSRYYNTGVMLRNGEKQFQSNNKFVDADFLSIFSFPFLYGDNKALQDTKHILISETMAEHLYGETDVIGKQVEVYIEDRWLAMQIGGVLKDIPANSDLNFHSLMRFELKPNYDSYKEDWSYVDHEVFVKVKQNKIQKEAFSLAARALVNQHLENDVVILKRNGATTDKNGDYLSLHLLPLKDYHLNNYQLGNAGSPTFPWVLLLISGLLLFIASSNFVNLSLAHSLNRNREVGTRKVLGGTTWELIKQLWVEAMLVLFIALLLGVLLVGVGIQEYNKLMNYSLSLWDLLSPLNFVVFVSSFLLLSLFAGAYPAWRIAKQNTLRSLKGTVTYKKSKLQNTLTVFQFSIASVLIVVTLIISLQLDYIFNRDLGYNKSEVISIPIGSSVNPERALEQMRHKLENQTWVQGVSASDINLGRGRDGAMTNTVFGFDYQERQIYTHVMRVDYDFLKTMEINLLEGRDFNRSFATDVKAVLINKKMAESLGGIEQVLNKTIELDENVQVIGMIEDFNFKDLKQTVGALTLSINPLLSPVEYIFVRVESDNLKYSLDRVQEVWKELFPDINFLGSYLDENAERMYRNEKRMSRIVISASGIAIFISCLGLFSLVLLSIRQRTKEIGIRKVLGSSVSHIVVLLSKDYLLLVLLSFGIAVPVSWKVMSTWLQNYAFRIDLKWWMWAVAGLITLFVALFTVGVKATQAARANPVESLRDE